jgi:pilus assembly protein Flp/PilA
VKEVKPLKDIISLMKDERGQGMAEYGLIIALVAIVVIVALTALGTALKGKFDKVTGTLK